MRFFSSKLHTLTDVDLLRERQRRDEKIIVVSRPFVFRECSALRKKSSLLGLNERAHMCVSFSRGSNTTQLEEEEVRPLSISVMSIKGVQKYTSAERLVVISTRD